MFNLFKWFKKKSNWLMINDVQNDYIVVFNIKDIIRLECCILNMEDTDWMLYLKNYRAGITIDKDAAIYILNKLNVKNLSFRGNCKCGGLPVYFNDESTNTQGITCSKHPNEHKVFSSFGRYKSRCWIVDNWDEQKFGNIDGDSEDTGDIENG